MTQILPVEQLQTDAPYRKTVTRQTETVPIDGEEVLT